MDVVKVTKELKDLIEIWEGALEFDPTNGNLKLCVENAKELVEKLEEGVCKGIW